MDEPIELESIDSEAQDTDQDVEELGLGKFLKKAATTVGKAVGRTAESVAEKAVKSVDQAAESVAKSVSKTVVNVFNPKNSVQEASKKIAENAKTTTPADNKVKDAKKALATISKNDAKFEKLHPRASDGKFTDKPAAKSSGLIPKVEDIKEDAANEADYDKFKKEFLTWNKGKEDFDKSELVKKRKEVKGIYDDADNHLKLVAKYKAQLKDVKALGAVDQYKKIESNISKHQNKAEELRKKADSTWKRPSKPYHVKAPVAPKGSGEQKFLPPGTGEGLVPKPPPITLPPKEKPGTPTTVPRLTD